MIKDKKKFYIVCLVGILMLIGIGYAYLSSNLSINGDAVFVRSTWNVHFLTPTVSSGSVSGTSVTTAATVTGTNGDTVEYSITLDKPTDYYEFTVPIKNDGTIDAMISSISNKIYSGTTEIEKPAYVGYSIKYVNGASVKEKQILRSNATENVKVKVYFRDDIEVNQLPSADTSLSFKLTINYVQADSTAIEVVAPAFNDANSWEDVIEGINDGTITPTVGATKNVTLNIDLDNDGTPEEHTYILRVANTTTPAECSTQGFSQTACGLVLEFADIITTHVMNSTDTNVGGWRDSEMRTYVNSDIYNALPSALRNAIIETTVVSGHGSTSGETNFTSTDILYLLSPMEVWGNNSFSQFDSARDLSRQMDYYSNLGVNNSSYSGAIKQYNGSNFYWWLRTADFYSTYGFGYVNYDGSRNSIGASYNIGGVAPTFRIG